MRSGPPAAKLDIDSSCFQITETGELTLEFEEGAVRLRKLPTPVLSGSGSRVFLSPTSWSTPVSII
jgi:hypothetical protein